MSSTGSDAGAISRDFAPSTNPFVAGFQAFRRWPVIPVAIVLILVIVALFAELVAPHDPLDGELSDRNVPPAWDEEGSSMFLLGTDHIGRGILSRMIFGARVSLLVASVVLGCRSGSGYCRGACVRVHWRPRR